LVSAAELSEIIELQKGKRILIVGDLMLDRFVSGDVSRISPEAPVPVVKVKREINKLGGAGNVALNVKSLGGEPVLVSIVGEDDEAKALRLLLKEYGLEGDGLIGAADRPTIIKTRILAQRQQIVRLDKEDDSTLDGDNTKRVIDYIKRMADDFAAVIVSDYSKGLINEELMFFLVERFSKDISIAVDPKPNNYRCYSGATVITPNLKETSEMALQRIETDSDLESAVGRLFKELRCKSILVTLGERGMALFEGKDKPMRRLRTRAREVFDVTGAGDTVIAAFTLALSTGTSMVHAMELANFAAGIVVGKVGTATASVEELLEYIEEHTD